MDFSMTESQKQAFQDATSMHAYEFSASIILLLGILIVIWLIAIWLGMITSDKHTKLAALYQFSVAVLVSISIGSLIYFT